MQFLPQQIMSEIGDPENRPTRILVIDDDESVSAAIQTILARRQYQTVTTSRAIPGIHAFRQSSFDVVMVDIFMPGLSGLDTIEHLRRSSSVPIIAMSGFRIRSSAESADYLEMAASRGATLCLRKPFTPAQLFEAIDRNRSFGDSAEGLAN